MQSGCDRILTSSTSIMTFRGGSAAAMKRAAVQVALDSTNQQHHRRLYNRQRRRDHHLPGRRQHPLQGKLTTREGGRPDADPTVATKAEPAKQAKPDSAWESHRRVVPLGGGRATSLPCPESYLPSRRRLRARRRRRGGQCAVPGVRRPAPAVRRFVVGAG
jgi:hypothetical protein